MKNHLIRCEAYRNSIDNQPVFSLQTAGAAAGPVAPDMPGYPTDNPYPPRKSSEGHHAQNPGPASAPPASGHNPVQDPGAPGPSHEQEHDSPNPSHEQQHNASAMDTSIYPLASGPPDMLPLPPAPLGPPGPPSNNESTANKLAKKNLNTLEKVRHAMGRSTKRMEGLEAVLKTQIADGMSNAATHVRAAIRDERDRLFKLSQTLVKQEMQLRDNQTMGVHY